MRGKILFAAGLAVGYVLGTRAGRERYEQIANAAKGFWNDPRVQKRVDQVEDFVKEKAPEVAEFVSDGAKKVVDQVTGRGPKKPAKPAAAKPTAAAAKKPAARKSAAQGTATAPSS
ncbi:YtxH domain-containing protein [Microcella sp.]|uniref:YtxH domain-containing protein n=1 Tax=Microcella sp. TaxID=1913979 RepID=UPI003F6FAF15